MLFPYYIGVLEGLKGLGVATGSHSFAIQSFLLQFTLAFAILCCMSRAVPYTWPYIAESSKLQCMRDLLESCLQQTLLDRCGGFLSLHILHASSNSGANGFSHASTALSHASTALWKPSSTSPCISSKLSHPAANMASHMIEPHAISILVHLLLRCDTSGWCFCGVDHCCMPSQRTQYRCHRSSLPRTGWRLQEKWHKRSPGGNHHPSSFLLPLKVNFLEVVFCSASLWYRHPRVCWTARPEYSLRSIEIGSASWPESCMAVFIWHPSVLYTRQNVYNLTWGLAPYGFNIKSIVCWGFRPYLLCQGIDAHLEV